MQVDGDRGVGSSVPGKKERKGSDRMKNMKLWLKAAVIRAVRTVAQSALATVGTAAVLGDVDWIMVASAATLAGILRLLTSIVTGLPEAQ